MSDQIPQLPVPSAEEIKKFKAKVPSDGVSGGMGLPIPSPEDIKKFKPPVAEKKKPTGSQSVSKTTKPSSESNQQSTPVPSESKSDPWYDGPYSYFSLPSEVREKIADHPGSYLAGGISYGFPTKEERKLEKILNTGTQDDEVVEYYLSKGYRKNERKDGSVNKLSKNPTNSLPNQVVTGPSALMPQQKQILPSQPKTLEAQEKVGALDDLWNTFKGAGLSTLANIAKVPEMAQTYALDLVTTAMGKNDEFNRLPAAAKKEIRNVVNSTSKVTPLPNVQLSNQAADYLNKRSEEVYQKTRQEEGDIVDEITNFAKNPSVEGVGNILYRGLKSTVESIPFMAGYAISPALVGVSAAAGKRAEDLEKTGGNLGVNYLLNSGITGGSEVLAQGVTNKIMGRAAKAAFGNPKAAEILGTGYKKLIVKEIAKDMGEEFAAEAATQATQDIADDILNGREVDWWGVGRRTLNAGITGAVSAGTIRSGGQVVGSARNYLATQIMPKAEKDKINNNIKTISELNTQKGDDINPEVNAVIDNKIKELEAQNTSMMSVAQSAVDNLTDDQIKQVVTIDDQLYDNYNKAKAIFDDQSMDQDAKELLLKDLLNNKQQLEQQKDAIQKQATSQVPVQPEAGVSGQVAKGESQAEPKGTAQEGQGQEVESKPIVIGDKVLYNNGVEYEVVGLTTTRKGTKQAEVRIPKLTDAEIQEKARMAVFGRNENRFLYRDYNDPKFIKEQSIAISQQISNFTATNNSSQGSITLDLIDLKKAEPKVTSQEGQGQEVVDITTNIPKQDLPKVMDLVAKIETGQQASSPEDLQTQQNYAKEVEALLARRAADIKPVEYSFDINTPTKFNESEMPEVAVDNIDWEASGMGNVYDAIDSYGGINDITVVDVRGKNADGLYEAKVRVRGQDTSREGVVVLKDPNAQQKPRVARKRKVSPEFTATEKVLSANGVYPSYENVEAIAEISKSKPGAITQEDIQGVVKVYNKKAKAIADAFNSKFEKKPIKLKPEDISFGTAFDIQNATAEETIGREKDKWGESQVIRERVENAGDILRELSSRGNRPDPGYLLEKVNKLKKWIEQNKKYPAESIPSEIETIEDFNKTNLRFTNIVDGYEYLNKFNSDILQKVKGEYEAIPTYTKEQAVALDLVLDLINNNIDGLESKLNDIENIANKIKQEGKLEIVPDVKLSKSAQASEKQITNENIQPKQPRAQVATEEATQGAQPEAGATEQPAQVSTKREEIKSSLEKLKDVGLLRSAITGKKDISAGEIDAQMALTDAMANVWKETTGRDDFYENFFNDVSEGDIDAIMEKGGVLFQNIELPQRPLTRVSLAVFDLPEFKRMEGQEVAINSVRDLARTRGKQIEKDLMQSTLEFDKYKDAKKISFDEFKSDVEMQVMKLEKIRTSSYASYGADNLGDEDVYGRADTIIYNSPVDHGEYGHFRGDFRPTAISAGTMTYGADMDWNDWEVRQIPGTDQYAAVDRSMPDNVSQDQLANYIGTAGTKEQVEKWIEARKNIEGDINVGLFGHTRVWYDKGSPYYLAELQSDYFQKNDPNDLYARQIVTSDRNDYAIKKYDENDKKRLREKLESDLGVDKVLKIKKGASGLRLFLDVNLDNNNPDFKEVLYWPFTEGQLNMKEGDSNARYRLLLEFHGIVHGGIQIPEKFKDNWALTRDFDNQRQFAWNIFDNYNTNRNNLINSYRQEYVKNEIEKIKNSEKGVSMLKQFIASQKVHELRLLRESFRNAAQEGAETLRFPTPYTLAVIEGYVNKVGESGTPYEIVSGNSDRLYQGDIIDYGGIEMVVVDANSREISVAPRGEVFVYDYYDFIRGETDNYSSDTIYQIRKNVFDANNITESDLDNIEFGDLPWVASGTEDILRNAIMQSEDGSISLGDIEDDIRNDINSYLFDQDITDLFWGDEIYSDGDQTYYLVERRGSIENFQQPDEYEEGSAKEDFERQISRDQQTVVNKYKELNKIIKKMRPDAEVVTDDNGMEWLETKLTPEDANNPLIAFQEEGGNIKGAVDFSNDNKASVYMFDGADISTLAHEMSGHLGRRFLEQLSSVDEDFAKDYEKAKEWAGVKDNQWSIAAEEKWSRGFERYLRDGKAPTKALKSVFENLRDWLKNIYKYIKGSSIDIELTPDITRVFDNLLGARGEVEFKNLPGYARMMGEVDGIVEKSFNRGVSYMQTMDNAIKYMEKSKVYEDANDTQREAMVREVRKMFKQKEKKAPTAQKILGQEPTKTTITIDESKELAKKLKALEAAEQTGRKIGYKEGLKESEQARKDILDYVKSLKVNNKISGSQFKAIVNALKANLLNPAIRKRVEERIDKIIKKANYADQLDRSNKLRSAIKKASKSKTLASNIARMAKKFAKVNPSAVDNIEEYIDMANIVYASISKPIRTIAEESMVNEYSEMRIKEAQEAKNTGLEDLFNSLVEQGLIPKNLSLAEIQQYILDQEQNKKAEESKQREKENRDVLGKVFDSLKDISDVMLNDGYNPFTGEDVTLSEAERQLLKDFTAMDLNKLPIASAYRAQEALMNYIVNGKKFGMLGILNRYQGAENVKIADEKGLKAADFRWAVGGSWWGSRKWAKEVESIPGLFTWLWRGRNRGAEVMKLMGLDEFMAGSAKGKLDRIEAENEYIAKFLDKKPNGKRFNNINNTYERLVYAYLSRSVDGSAEEKQAEFDRRKRILGQNVQAMYQSRNKELIEEGEVLKRELDKAKGAKNIDELKGKFDPINEQAVEFISAKFDQYFDLIDGVAEGVYNLILNKDELYTPDMFRSIIDKETNVAEMKSSVDIPFDLLSKKPVGTMLENKRIQNLPGYDVENQDASNVEKILKLDFDSSAFNALEKSLVDAYTAEAVQKYSAFVNSKDFKKLFDNAKDETLFKEIVNYYINNERGKVGYKSDWRAVQAFSARLKNFATYRALGSATAFLKQSVSAMVNTAVNLSNDPYALKQVATAMLKDPAIGDFINRSRAEINLRGAEATADIKSAEKLIRESKYQTLTDVLDVVDKAGRFQMKSLNIGDVPMARASWFGYYVHALKQQGKPYKNIDWSTAKLDKDALAYANREVSLNQNASMPSTLGQLFSSKNPGTRLVATYFFPFTSFLFNAKSRLKTDITVLTSKLATAEDKQAAGRSMAATLAEMPSYIAISTAINYALVSMAQAFLGYDEDEEDEKLRLKRYSELAVTRILTDLLSPLPNVGDVATVAAFNALLEKMQEDPEMTKEEQMDVFKLFESKPESMAGAMAELLAQPIASTVRRVDDIYTTIDMATGDYYVNDKGTEIEFSAEDKRMLQIAAAIQIMGSLNLLPSEAESLAKKMVRTIEKRAKE